MQLKILVRPAQRGRLVSVSKLYFEIKVISKLTVASGGFGGGGTSAFGAKPAFGAFGGGGNTSTFGSGGTGAFGQTPAAGTSAGGGMFGNTANNTSNAGGFGGGGTSLFGAPKPATGFGSTPSREYPRLLWREKFSSCCQKPEVFLVRQLALQLL